MTIQMPDYPKSSGHRAALQLANAAATYRAKAEAVRKELAKVDRTVAEALARDDAAASTQARIDALAHHHRTTSRHG